MAENYLGYEVRSDGTVISHRRSKPRKLKHHIHKQGYVRVALKTGENQWKFYYVHRLLAELYIPNPDNKPMVNHKNGIKDDNRLENLEWVDAKENVRHSYTTGLKKKSKSCKLNGKDAQLIKFLIPHYTQVRIAKAFKVDQSLISDIKRGKRWSYVVSGGAL